MNKLLNLALTAMVAVLQSVMLRKFNVDQANVEQAAALAAATELVSEALNEVKGMPDFVKAIFAQPALVAPVVKYFDNLVENFLATELGALQGGTPAPTPAPVSAAAPAASAAAEPAQP